MSAGCPLPYPLDLHDLFQGVLDLRLVSTQGPGDTVPDHQERPPPARGHKAGRYAYCLSRRALRALLSDRFARHVGEQEWVLASSPQGKPQVLGPVAGLEVSLAFADSLCIVAAARGRPLGVDLEPLPCRLEDDLPDHLLAPPEIALIRDAPDTFATVWTLKEALAKERGTGLSEEMARLDTTPYVMAPPGQVQERPDGGAAFHGRFCQSGRHYAFALTLGARLAPPPWPRR